MMKTEVILAVKDVKESAVWYQKLLTCKAAHGGDVFEILTDQNDEVILSLHKWGEHDHPTLSDQKIPAGNGLIVYFKVENISAIWETARKLDLKLEKKLHLNTNSGRREFSLRDPDGYYLSISA